MEKRSICENLKDKDGIVSRQSGKYIANIFLIYDNAPVGDQALGLNFSLARAF